MPTEMTHTPRPRTFDLHLPQRVVQWIPELGASDIHRSVEVDMTAACRLDNPEGDVTMAEMTDVGVEGELGFAVDDEEVAAGAATHDSEIALASGEG